MNNLIHVYQMRHVFTGDDYVGKYDVQKRQIRIAPEFAPLLEEVKAFFMQSFGIPATALIGDEEPAHAIPLVEFPDHIRSQMTPSLGDLTPAVVSYAKQHFTAKEFNRRYAGRQPILPETIQPEQTQEADSIAESPKPRKPGRPKKSNPEL